MWEDPTCREATKTVCRTYGARVPKANKRSHCNENLVDRNQRVVHTHHH